MTMLGRRQKCLRIWTEKRQGRVSYVEREGPTGPLRPGEKPFRLKTRLETSRLQKLPVSVRD